MRRFRLGQAGGRPVGIRYGLLPNRKPGEIAGGPHVTLASNHPRATWILEAAGEDGRGARLIARTLFKEMQRSGFSHHQILAVADELLGCLCAKAEVATLQEPSADSWEPDGTGD